jgi:flagellar basal body-associated protein FliL
MEIVLIIITIVSVAAAIVAFMSARRAHQNERERSEARVAALAAAAEAHGSSDGGWMQVGGEWQWTSESPGIRTAEPAGIRDSGLGIRREAPITTEHSENMFGTVQREGPAGSRFVLVAAAALILMLGGALVFLSTSSSDDDHGTVASAPQADPLELVSLAHARASRVLTISGTVRNPSSGSKIEGLTAVVSLLDNNGGLISTKDVPLDYRALGPGEEAPFTVSVPDAGSVARYRVSFRAGTAVVPHVDRRNDAKLASAVR